MVISINPHQCVTRVRAQQKEIELNADELATPLFIEQKYFPVL